MSETREGRDMEYFVSIYPHPSNKDQSVAVNFTMTEMPELDDGRVYNLDGVTFKVVKILVTYRPLH